MQNPFESGHIKNYVLLYVSVVLIMVLFFIAATLFHDVSEVEKKVFNAESNESLPLHVEDKVEDEFKPKFKLMNNSY